MDNRQIDISSEGKKDFDLAIKIAIGSKSTIGYRVHENCLVLYSVTSKKMIDLPYGMNPQETCDFAWGWFERNKPLDKQPDHDGDNEKGFRVFNESWGHVFGEWEAFIAIKPIWAMYGK